MIKYSKILSIFIVSLSAQDLNVDGGMNVSGNINMENNQIKNIGDPSNENDAVNLRTLSNSGMKPTRIYRGQINDETQYIVPADKAWKLLIYCQPGYEDMGYIRINDILYPLNHSGGNNGRESSPTRELWLMPNDIFFFSQNHPVNYYVNIFEYSFTNSGVSQGLDYVEP